MLTFVTLSRWSPEVLPVAETNEELERNALQKIRQKYPEVEWLHNREAESDGNYSHIFITPDIETAEDVAEIVGTFGYAIPEVWTATDWTTYKRMLRKLPKES